jgi:phosphate acetyltransferase
MNIIDGFIEKAKKEKKKIVFPEGTDERILKAARDILDKGIAAPVVLGKEDEINALAKKADLNLKGLEIVNPETSPLLDKFASVYAKRKENITEGIAKKLVRRSLFFGCMMVAEGEADGIVAGIAHATASVLQAAGLAIGYPEGIQTPSSFFIMVLPEFQGKTDNVLIFADCAVNISPDSKQLAEIAVTTGRNAKGLLDIDPRVALLSFSTKGSASHEDADKVIKATEIARGIAPELTIDGELQLDAAIVPRVAQKKVKASEVAGKANVLIFPDLDSGNIAYKLTQYLAGAQAYGPILQGFKKPVCDLSRGASSDDVVGITAIVAAQAQI